MKTLETISRAYWWGHHHFKGLPQLLASLAQHQTMDESQARRDLAVKLRRRLSQAARIPGAPRAWAELDNASSDEVFHQWQSLPILTKKDLRERFPPERILPSVPRGSRINTTGGSTGEPTRFVHDRAMLRSCTATMYFAWRLAGWCPGMPVLGIWGAQRDIGLGLGWKGELKRNVLSLLGRIEVMDGFALTESRAQAALDLLSSSATPMALYGYTSLLDAIARLAVREGIKVPSGKVAAAWNGGECVFPDQADRFGAVFGAPLCNNYGGREMGTLAIQERSRIDLAVLRPFVFLEIVDDLGMPCQPGQVGRVLATSTTCGGTPFIRYEVGDLAAASGIDASGVRRIQAPEGRVSGLLNIRGREISNIYWNHLFKEYQAIEAFQIRAGADELRILLQGMELNEGILAEVQRRIDAFLEGYPIAMERVERIPLSPAGKRLQVVREERSHA